MPRLPPLQIVELPPDLAAIVRSAEDYMGFIANDALTMAYKPEMLRAALPFMRSIYREDAVSFALKRLVGMMASWSGGCGYCVAHTAHGAARLGTPEAKIAALAAFETDPQFDAAERAALRVARSAGQVPNAVSETEWSDLQAHFTPEQVVEIVAVIALFGFLNRWNATFATELESSPLAFASRVLRPASWQPGPHG